jgi:hypothetical protein
MSTEKEGIDFTTEDVEGGYDSSFEDDEEKDAVKKRSRVHQRDLARRPEPTTHTQGD